MRVVCDQCAASYKVPNARLTKPINKATCRSCGSRLLIPKPQPGADEEERIVVPAVPATSPMSASGFAPGDDDDDEKTIPVVDRRPANTSTTQDDVPLVSGAPIGKAERDVIARAQKPPAPPVISRSSNRPGAPAAPAAGGSGGSLAVVSGLLAVAGLVMLMLVDSPSRVFVALLLASTGGITALLVLAFQSTGEADGRPAASLGIGLAAGVLIAGLGTALQVFTSPETDGLPVTGSPVKATTATAPVAAAPPGSAAAGAAPGSAAPPVGAPPSPTDPVIAPPAAPPAPVRTSADPAEARQLEQERRRLEDERRRLEAERRAAAREPEPRREDPIQASPPPPEPVREAPPPPPPPPPPAAATTVPPEVIKTIVSSNVSVKRCLYDGLRSGEIVKPVSIKLSFFLSAAGRASNVRVNSPSSLSSGSLSRCLDSAFQTMSFPASSEGRTVNYPIVL